MRERGGRVGDVRESREMRERGKRERVWEGGRESGGGRGREGTERWGEGKRRGGRCWLFVGGGGGVVRGRKNNKS